MKTLKSHALVLIGIGIITCILAYVVAGNIAFCSEVAHLIISDAEMTALHSARIASTQEVSHLKEFGGIITEAPSDISPVDRLMFTYLEGAATYNGLMMYSGVITVGLGIFSLVINRKK